MSLILLDGMEDLSSFQCNPSFAPTLVAGRNGNCHRITNTTAEDAYTLAAAAESDTFTVGFAYRLNGSLGAQGICYFCSDTAAGAIAPSTYHCGLRLEATGAISFCRAFTTPSTLATSATGLIVPNTWYYIEMQAKLHDTTGFAIVRLNGATIINLTNVDTKNAGTKTTFDSCSFRLGLTGSIDIDDVYLKSGTGDTFFGDTAVETLYPNGNGNANQWAPVGAAAGSNWQAVDEVGAPATADYTYSSTVGQQDLYALTDSVAAGTILGVCHSAYMLRTDSVTSMNVKLVNRRSADTKSAALPLSTIYRSYEYALATDPETGAAWTGTNVNALQSGVELA